MFALLKKELKAAVKELVNEYTDPVRFKQAISNTGLELTSATAEELAQKSSNWLRGVAAPILE